MIGDFNLAKFPKECGKEGRLTVEMRRFSVVIEDLELRDLPLQEGLCVEWRSKLPIKFET